MSNITVFPTATQKKVVLCRGTITRHGFRLPAMDCCWWAEWMATEDGRVVVLRYDADDLRTAQCYDEAGDLIGSCELRLVAGDKVAAAA